MKIIESHQVGRLLTHCEYAALEYLHEHGPAPPSSIGYMVREKVPEKVERKRNPLPQGMALFASKIVRRLWDEKLVRPAKYGYEITREGSHYIVSYTKEV